MTYKKNLRNIQDALLFVTKALPAANAANYTNSLDLGQVNGGEIENINLVVKVEATTTLVEAKTITLTLKDSANNETFAAITGVAALTVTGKTTTGGSEAFELRLRLPPDTKRYIRLDAAVENGGGDNTGTNYSLAILV